MDLRAAARKPTKQIEGPTTLRGVQPRTIYACGQRKSLRERNRSCQWIGYRVGTSAAGLRRNVDRARRGQRRSRGGGFARSLAGPAGPAELYPAARVADGGRRKRLLPGLR